MKSGIYSYLTFSGNCREAMQFYKQCLGGKLQLQTIWESPLSARMSKKMKACILHAVLVSGNLVLMGTDMVMDEGLEKGNAVSLLLQCKSGKELRNYYQKLSDGGTPTHPPEKTFFGALMGNLTDKYGNHWLLHFDGKGAV
jgi:PhnB protein